MLNQRHWHSLGNELKQRSCLPWRHPSFVIYFLLAVIGIGAAGIWWELYRVFQFGFGLENLRTAIHTFFPVLTATTGLQLIWAEGTMRSMRAFSAFVIVMCILGWAINSSIQSDVPSLYVGGAFSLIALWLWVVTNAKQSDFLDASNDAPVGGALSRHLKGDLTEYDD